MLCLVRKVVDGQQVFDLSFDSGLESLVDAQVSSLIYVALFTDARAPDELIGSRVQDDPRGWWLDSKAGSGLWHVRRQGLSAEARAEALSEVRRALTVYAPALTDVMVSEVGAGSVSVVELEVTGKHNGRTFSVGLTL